MGVKVHHVGWDLETFTGLLEQEGHSREVYALVFQPVGALAAAWMPLLCPGLLFVR